MSLYTIAIANQKGGSGKTTTAVNLSACLEDEGHKVLLVDLDPQAQASTWWRVEELESKGTIFDTLLETRTSSTPMANLGIQVHGDLVLLPSANITPDDEARLNSQPRRFSRLRESLNQVSDDYDFAIIDCPPTLGVLTQNALLASDAVVLTVEASFLAIHGMARMLELIEQIRRKHPIEVFALATRFDQRTTVSHEILEDMQNYFGNMMLKTVIRENVRLKEAASYGEPIIEFSRKSRGAEDYRKLTKELLKRVGA